MDKFQFKPWLLLPLILVVFQCKSDDKKTEVESFMEKAIISQSVAFNSGNVLFTDGGVKLKIFGLKPNPEFSIDDMTTFPFFDAFIDMKSYQVKSTPSLTDIRNKGFAHDGYFYELLQTEDWQRAEQEEYFGKYQVDLTNAIKNLSDKEDPILIKYKVAF